MFTLDFLSLSLIIAIILIIFIAIIFFLRQKYEYKISNLILENEYLASQIILKDEHKDELKKEFENLSNRVFYETSQKSNQNLNQILTPLKEQIFGFSRKVDEVFLEETKQRVSLSDEIKNLKELNTKISLEANNLTNALKGQSKIQGDWGEMILESILEKSHLRKDYEYFVQNSYKDENQRVLRPDVVVKLPNNKDIVIDSKLSLNSYIDFVNQDEKSAKDEAFKRLNISIKNHIKDLSSKSYENLQGLNSLDFVLMFIPIEEVFILLNKNSKEIFELANKHKIMIVSANTLQISLRVIENIWQDERQNENAKEISKEASLMYDKFVAFVEDMENIGNSLNKSYEAYNKALNKLSTGRGNLISRSQKFLDLGVKPTKELNQKYLIKEEL